MPIQHDNKYFLSGVGMLLLLWCSGSVTADQQSILEARWTDGHRASSVERGQEENTGLSLEELVTRALENHPGLQAQRLSPAIAGTFEIQEQALFDAVLFAEFEAQRQRRESSASLESERLEAGLRQRLPSGTEITLSFRGERLQRDTPEGVFSGRGGIGLTQALLRGAQREVNLLRLQQATLVRVASDYELRGFIEVLVADVEHAYWDLILAMEEIRIFEAALEVAAQQLKEILSRIAAGDRPETEAIRARAELALRRQGLLEAELGLALAADRLSQKVRAPWEEWDQTWVLNVSPELWKSPQGSGQFPLATWKQLGLDLRSELNEARLRLERDELELIQTRDALLPRLDFFIVLGASGYAREFLNAFPLRGQDGYDLAAGLRFEYPIGRRDARAGVERSLLERQRALLAIQNLEQRAILDVRAAWHEVDRTQAQILARAETVELQQEMLRVAEIRFRVGAGTGLDIAQAQRDVLEGQLSLLSARVRHRQARTNLLLQSGTLLLHRGIEMTGRELPYLPH